MEVTYRVQEGYRLPNLLLPQEAEAHLGRYAELRRQYIKKHRRVLYTNLKTSGQLAAHLAEIEETAQRMVTQADFDGDALILRKGKKVFHKVALV